MSDPLSDDLGQAMAAFQRCLEDRDVDLASEMLDDDYALVLVQPDRFVMPRAQWLSVLPGYVVHEYTVEEQIVDVDGDCAAVLHRVTMKATVLGEDRSGSFVISDVWRRRDGVWRIWRRHSTPASAGPIPGDAPRP